MTNKDLKVTVVVLTWQRIPRLKSTLEMLHKQTYKNFNVYLSNANEKKHQAVANFAEYFTKYYKMDVTASFDGNETFAFRRMAVGKRLLESGTDVVLFIDDDVDFLPTYVETCLSKYEPKSYKSNFAWNVYGENYYKDRTRIFDEETPVNYVGTGVAMIDASIFKEKGLLNPPKHLWKGAMKTEDLWLSYYANYVMKWKLQFMYIPGTKINGDDNVALFKSILQDDYTKADFLTDLRKEGWKI
jgi:hypothetical protein